MSVNLDTAAGQAQLAALVVFPVEADTAPAVTQAADTATALAAAMQGLPQRVLAGFTKAWGNIIVSNITLQVRLCAHGVAAGLCNRQAGMLWTRCASRVALVLLLHLMQQGGKGQMHGCRDWLRHRRLLQCVLRTSPATRAWCSQRSRCSSSLARWQAPSKLPPALPPSWLCRTLRRAHCSSTSRPPRSGAAELPCCTVRSCSSGLLLASSMAGRPCHRRLSVCRREQTATAWSLPIRECAGIRAAHKAADCAA